MHFITRGENSILTIITKKCKWPFLKCKLFYNEMNFLIKRKKKEESLTTEHVATRWENVTVMLVAILKKVK